MNDLRMIANPQLLASEKITINKNTNEYSFPEKLKDILDIEFCGIYISKETVTKIETNIREEINNIMIERIVQDCLDTCIENVIKEKKFDFSLPFD